MQYILYLTQRPQYPRAHYLLEYSREQLRSKKTTFKPTIINYDASVEMRWVGILGTPFLFRGEHYFKLEKIDELNTRLIHGEIFSGLLAPIFSALGGKKTLTGFNLMNSNLKAKAEKNMAEST